MPGAADTTLLEDLPLPAFLYDVDTLRFLDVNRSALDLYGYPREEFLALLVTDIRPRAEVPRMLKTLAALEAGGRSVGIWTHQRKDGSPIQVEIFSRGMLESGRRTRLAVAIDVTDKLRAEWALRESERLLAEAQRLAKIATWENDLETGELSWSPECARILEYPPDVKPDLTIWRERVDEEQRGPMLAARQLCIQDGTPFEMDLKLDVPSGLKYGHLIGELRTDGPRRLVGTLQDVTERVRLQQERDRLFEQLQHSQRLDAVGRLAGGVAHDFNNMMTVVTNFAQLVLDRLPEESPLRADVREIEKAAERASDLTRQLLAFGRKQLLQPQPLQLNDLVLDLERMLRPLVGESVELSLVLGPRLPELRLDPGQITQVIVNLAVNAREAMPHGGRLVLETTERQLDEAFVRSHSELKPGRYVLLKVSDSGVGMTREVRERVFEPFFTTRSNGTGLGLATVYGIVKQSGGHISVASEPDQGAVFEVYLPVAPGVGPAEPLPAPESAQPGTGCILVVEDDELVGRSIRAILSRAGYDVLLARGAEEAEELARATTGRIDILLTDVVMPRFDGKAVARTLLALRPELRVIYMSGYTENSITHRGVIDPGIDFIQKPFTSQQLTALVRKAMARGRP